jgi:hypothetical protein
MSDTEPDVEEMARRLEALEDEIEEAREEADGMDPARHEPPGGPAAPVG